MSLNSGEVLVADAEFHVSPLMYRARKR